MLRRAIKHQIIHEKNQINEPSTTPYFPLERTRDEFKKKKKDTFI